MERTVNQAMARICRQQASVANRPGAKEALLDLAEFYEADESVACVVRRRQAEGGTT